MPEGRHFSPGAESIGLDAFKLVIVDDEQDFLDTVVNRMSKRSVDVTGIGSGKETLDFIDNHPVDVIVLDVKMPGMDGIDTLREIKRRHPLIEVMMLTGHASMEVAVETMELGAFDYLMKPTSTDDLLYKIQDAFKKKSIQEEKICKIKEKFEPDKD